MKYKKIVYLLSLLNKDFFVKLKQQPCALEAPRRGDQSGLREIDLQ